MENKPQYIPAAAIVYNIYSECILCNKEHGFILN